MDLSVPKNVKEDVEQVEGVTLVHMDALSQMTSDAMERRKTFIPQAKQIISEVSSEFFQWLDSRRFAPAIQALKSKLENMKNAELDFQRKKSPILTKNKPKLSATASYKKSLRIL